MKVSTFTEPRRPGPGARLEILGVRGAFPTADPQFLEYGGNTSCMALFSGGGVLCFDAGSGFIGLPRRLPDVRRIDILIGHVHIDHIMGLYYLNTIRVPEIHFYGEALDGVSFRQRMETPLRPPYWPLDLCAAPGVHFHEISPGSRFVLPREDGAGIPVQVLQANHPNGGVLYRADLEQGSVVYAVDCEMNETIPAQLAEFARDCALLIWDANFTRDDKHPGWGHSTWEEGLDVARRAGAGAVLMTHYSRDYTDTFLREQERLARSRNRACIFAREGMVIDL